LKLLLDTHLLLWAAGMPERLPAEARTLLGDPRIEPLFSSASLWEIAIKRSLGRSDFQVDTRLLRRGLLDNGYLELGVTSEHAVAIEGLPLLHRDTFDRLSGCTVYGGRHYAAHRCSARGAALRASPEGLKGRSFL
jgi:PIN domain nuclease of toxin-antitoxin system